MVSGTAFAALAIYRNGWIFSLVAGSLVNAAIGKVVKRVLKTRRPAPSTRPSHGMPSSHANSLFFFATSLAMRTVATAAPTLGNPGGSGAPWVGIRCAALFGYATMIAGTRVYTEDHTVPQIVVGAMLGAGCAIVNENLFAPHFM